MSEPIAVARQATFNTEPADSVASGGSIRRGNIELPVVDTANISIKAKTTDRNNNDGEYINNNNNNNNNNDINGCSHFSTINDESDTDIDSYSVQDQQHNFYTNNAEQTTAPPSNQSSPIYGSRSGYEKFNRKYASTRKRTPSLHEESSDLEILSDVGIADDSDCDVIPVVTPLSLSARRKTRKAPRIKIPSSKIDNTEPTIQEETTQDILNIFAREPSSGLVPLKSKVSSTDQASSEPAIVENQNLEADESETVSVKNVDAVFSKNVEIKTDTNNIAKLVDKDQHPLTVSKGNLSSTIAENKKPEHTGTKVNIIKRIISRKHDRLVRQGTESDREPLTSREPKINRLESEVVSNRPHSAGDKPKPKTNTRQHTPEDQPSTTCKTLQLNLDPSDSSRPPSRSVQTPIISNFLQEGNGPTGIESSLASKKPSTVYSGVPRPFDTSIRETLPKENQHSNQFLAPPKLKLPENMETSDGYDYESETFEEILQERNAMVKAERTYQKRIKQLEEELKGMINQCQALSDENKDLRKTIDVLKKAEKEKNEPKPDPPAESTIELSARIAKLEAEKENLVKLNESLSLSMKTDSSKSKNSDIVFVENTKLKNKNTELEKRIQVLQHEIENLHEKLKDASKDTSGKSAVLEFKNKELEVTVGELKYENKSMVSKIKSLENDKHLITNSLEEKRIELNEMMRAMQNETATESELKQSKTKLEGAQEEINSVKNELEQMKIMLQESQIKKEKLQNNLSQKDLDIRKIKGEHENKEKNIRDLRLTNENLRGEILRHEENQQVYRGIEHETSALKSRIASLKTEIESSLAENQRYKYEREEANREIDRLRNENAVTTDAVHESRKYFRKWESEREARNKAEVALAHKSDEVNDLNGGLKECGMKINVLYGRVRAAEEDRDRFRGPNAQELETNNKILKDENKKLRQLLIERNVELTNKTNEKEILDNRIGILEKKQKNADFRVKQLSGWVGSINSMDSNPQESHNKINNKQHQQQNSNPQHVPPRPSLSNANKSQTQTYNQSFNQHSPRKRTGVKEPIIAVISPRSRKKRTVASTMTPPPSWDEKGGRYYNDIEGNNHTPLSLPLINESNKPRTPNNDFNGGYFHLYKERMKKARDKQFD